MLNRSALSPIGTESPLQKWKAQATVVLKSSVRGFAWRGTSVSVFAIVAATALDATHRFDELSFEACWEAQRTNPILWLLDLLPFAYMFWGQFAHLQHERVLAERAAHTAKVQARRAARMDQLTQLTNRLGFVLTLRDRLAGVGGGGLVCVGVIDVGNLRDVDQILGEGAGDAIVQDLAKAIASATTVDTTVGRIDPWRFALLLPEQQKGAEAFLAALAKDLERPLSIRQTRIQPRVSLGIAIYPKDGQDADTLLRIAVSHAKHDDHIQRLANPLRASMTISDGRHASLARDFPQALQAEQLRLYWHPIVAVASGFPVGAEALIRWLHPAFGLVQALDVLWAAKAAGMEHALSRWALRTAVAQSVIWQRAGRHLMVSVNLLPSDIHSEDLVDFLGELLSRAQVDGRFLQLEIEEQAFTVNAEGVIRTVEALKAQGIAVVIADFGGQRSSIATLTTLPVSTLKLDSTFSLDLADSPARQGIVRGVLSMARDLGWTSVATGVEDPRTLRKYKTLGCDYAQGFLFAHPLPESDLEPWIVQKFQVAAEQQAAEQALD